MKCTDLNPHLSRTGDSFEEVVSPPLDVILRELQLPRPRNLVTILQNAPGEQSDRKCHG